MTDTITTLVASSGTCYTLMIDTETRVGDKVYRGRPKLVKRYFGGGTAGRLVANTLVGKEDLEIASQPVRSEVRRIVFTSGKWTRTSKVHVSATKSPYVLKRTTKSKSDDGKIGYVTEVTASHVDQVRKVLGEPKTVSEVEVIHEEGGQKIKTIESHCGTVPGAVVAHEMETTDAKGALVTRSRLELIDYYVSPGKSVRQIRRGRRGLLPRRRKRR